jgi:PAS domain-containing protein
VREEPVQDNRDVHQMLHQTLLGDAWEHARVAVAVFDDDRRFIAFNAAFCRLTGFRRDELLSTERAPELPTGRGAAELGCSDGRALPVDSWAIDTTVSGLPYSVALFWPRDDA